MACIIRIASQEGTSSQQMQYLINHIRHADSANLSSLDFSSFRDCKALYKFFENVADYMFFDQGDLSPNILSIAASCGWLRPVLIRTHVQGKMKQLKSKFIKAIRATYSTLHPEIIETLLTNHEHWFDSLVRLLNQEAALATVQHVCIQFYFHCRPDTVAAADASQYYIQQVIAHKHLIQDLLLPYLKSKQESATLLQMIHVVERLQRLQPTRA